jgi:replicative DNA helicase
MATGTVINSIQEEDGQLSSYRTLPHNLEAEQALLGAILINNEALNQVAAFLTPEHFYLPVHGRIFTAVLKMTERGQIASPVTLKHFFDNDDSLSDVGGAQYLARLAGSAVTIINAEHYGRAIYDLAMRRELIAIGEDMVNEAYDASLDESATEQIENSEQKLFNLAEEGGAEGGFRAFHQPVRGALDMITQACKRDGQLSGVTTGLRDMDKLLGGLHSSDLIILAGRPGMGKTALATNIAFNAARAFRQVKDEQGNVVAEQGAKVGFFSLEMSAEQLATRVLAERAEISSEKLRKGELKDSEFSQVVRASQEIESLPIFIDDTPALTVAGLRARARRLKRQHGLSLVVVDYLQLMRPGSSVRLNNRVQEVSEITQGLKALAKELNVPVLALSQLSRAVEQRDDKRPQLSDLRESGSIEQDADVVMFVYREQYYLQRKQPEDGTTEHAEWMERMERVHNLAEVIVAKQRHGPTGKVELFFNEYLTLFKDFDRVHSQIAEDAPF